MRAHRLRRASWLALLLTTVLTAAACEVQPDAPLPWVGTRDALLAPARDWPALPPAHADALRSALAPSDGAQGDEAIALDAAPGDTVALLAALDATRLRAGLEPRVAGAFVLDPQRGVLEIADCAPLLPALGAETTRAPSGLVLAPSAAALRPWLPALEQWLASCPEAPADDAATPITVRLVDGAPVLAAWWPRLRVLELHPALLAVAPPPAPEPLPALDHAVRAIPLGAFRPPFTFGDGADCLVQLDDYCTHRCPTGAEAACRPLFPGAAAQDCAALRASHAAADAMYCSWMQYEREPDLAFCMYRGEALTTSKCFDPRVAIVDPATLAEALPFGACEPNERDCPEQDVPALPDAFPALEPCIERLEIYCSTCGVVAPSRCASLFEDSTPVQDCYDLQRDELYGHGFTMFCARELAEAQRDLYFCVNADETCYTPPNDGGFTHNFQSLEDTFGGFVEPTTADACRAQLERCVAGQPLEPIDLGATQPGASPETPGTDEDEEEESSGCPF